MPEDGDQFGTPANASIVFHYDDSTWFEVSAESDLCSMDDLDASCKRMFDHVVQRIAERQLEDD
jgi:hypothetical protein